MTGLLLSFLPDHALVLVIMAAGFGLMLGILTRRTAAGLIGMVLLFAILSPFVDALMDAAPMWLLIVVLGFFAISFLRIVMGALFGKAATAVFLGNLLFAIFVLPFRLIGILFGIRRR